MHRHENQPAMEQKIFKMGLSTEAVSLYLLCCHLVDADTPITTNELQDIWNGTSQMLEASIKELSERNIIVKEPVTGEQTRVFRLNEARRWRSP